MGWWWLIIQWLLSLCEKFGQRDTGRMPRDNEADIGVMEPGNAKVSWQPPTAGKGQRRVLS